MAWQSQVRPNTWVALRLPSDILKLVEIIPNTIISVGKFGTFPANLLLGRPFYVTYEVIEQLDDESKEKKVRLRPVSAAELNAEILAEDTPPSESRGEPGEGEDASSFDIAAEDGSLIMKNNRLTIDDASRQTLTMEEIEEMKKAGSGKDIIQKIMKAHTNIDEKTAFSLAKYAMRKAKKYMRRFTVLPLDPGRLEEWLLADKDPGRIMELREESLGLVTAWSNVHYGGDSNVHPTEDGAGKIGGGRWLVIDETGGMIVAGLAEKMDLLYPRDNGSPVRSDAKQGEEDELDGHPNGESTRQLDEEGNAENVDEDETMIDAEDQPDQSKERTEDQRTDSPAKATKSNLSVQNRRQIGELASTNAIHLIHANAQPNVSLLKYFNYDTNNPSTTHPLHTHFKAVSWLQLLDPEADTTYTEPPSIPNPELASMKSGKRGAYYKKRRRWERCKATVDETRAGGFDGLVVASYMDPCTILSHLVPLVRGGGHIVVYSPVIEPLAAVVDLYSRDRKAAYLSHLDRFPGQVPPKEDFPLDPRLLLAPTLQTSRVRPWQVLPGRTHPVMTMRGGAEGYVFTARRVLPVDGRVEARGNFAKKRKVG